MSNLQDDKRAARRAEGTWTNTLRSIIRYGTALSLVAALFVFALFWRYVSTGEGVPYPRPDAADAFLPFAGFAQLKLWFATGAWDHSRLAAEHLASLGKRILGRNFYCLGGWTARCSLRSMLAFSLCGGGLELPRSR